jgi:hypothetical protein
MQLITYAANTKQLVHPRVYENFMFDNILLTFKVSKNNLKGIDRPFELRGESRLIRSVITNWMLGKFFYLILKSLHHKISKKPWDAAYF